MNDLEFCRNFSKIKIKGLCEKNNINRTWIFDKRCKNENKDVIKLRKLIENEIAKLYIIKEDYKNGS